MKTVLIAGVLMVGLCGQTFSMGHPHNMFAARKQMRAKTGVSTVKSKAPACSLWQSVVQVDKNAFSKRLLSALSRVRPAQSY